MGGRTSKLHQGSLKNWHQPGGCHQPTGGYTHGWQVWHFSHKAGGSVLSGLTQPSILPGKVHEQGETLRLPGGTPWPYQGPGAYYGGTLVTVVTAVLKTASLPGGGHTAATELRSTSSDTSMGIKQSSLLCKMAKKVLQNDEG